MGRGAHFSSTACARPGSMDESPAISHSPTCPTSRHGSSVGLWWLASRRGNTEFIVFAPHEGSLDRIPWYSSTITEVCIITLTNTIFVWWLQLIRKIPYFGYFVLNVSHHFTKMFWINGSFSLIRSLALFDLTEVKQWFNHIQSHTADKKCLLQSSSKIQAGLSKMTGIITNHFDRNITLVQLWNYYFYCR